MRWGSSRTYSAARPPHSEGLAICIASYLAHETNCVNINLLHLTSRKAVEAALKMAKAFPHVNFRREVTVGHLLLDYDAPTDVLAKVNPPIRSRAVILPPACCLLMALSPPPFEALVLRLKKSKILFVKDMFATL